VLKSSLYQGNSELKNATNGIQFRKHDLSNKHTEFTKLNRRWYKRRFHSFLVWRIYWRYCCWNHWRY